MSETGIGQAGEVQRARESYLEWSDHIAGIGNLGGTITLCYV